MYLFLHESIHKVNYNHNIRYCCIQRCNHDDLIEKNMNIVSRGRAWAVLDLPSIFTYKMGITFLALRALMGGDLPLLQLLCNLV